MNVESDNSNISASSLCGNCCKNLETEKGSAKEFDLGPEKVQIINAISYIYGISEIPWGELLMSLERKGEKLNCVEEDTVSVDFCETCTMLLWNNYESHKKFENESHPSSIIHQISTYRQQQWQMIALQKYEFPNGEEFSQQQNYDQGDLVESFNFERHDDDGQMDTPVEYKPENSELSRKEYFKSSLKQSSSRDSIDSKQVVVKLEKIPNKSIRNPSHLVRRKAVAYRKRATLKKKNSGSSSRRKLKHKKSSEIIPNHNDGIIELRKYTRDPNTKGYKCQCKVCGQKFLHRHYYQTYHLPLHYGKNANSQCSVCGKVLRTGSLKLHMKIMHEDKRDRQKTKVACQICGSVVFDYCLRFHMKEQHSNSRQAHKCDRCDKSYLKRRMYEEHILTHSEQFTPFLCGQCGKTFDTKKNLLRHEKTHTEERNYPCDKCTKKFATNGQLKLHVQSHATERQFVCEECGKSYKFKAHFRMHLKLHKEIEEKGENAFKCQDCGKFFKHSQSLYKHTSRMHRADLKKIYECSFCGKRLTRLKYLQDHENLHRSNPGFQPRKSQNWKKSSKS